MTTLRSVHVDLGDRSYDVLVGSGVRSELAAMLPKSARRAATPYRPPTTVFHLSFRACGDKSARRVGTPYRRLTGSLDPVIFAA